MPHHRDPHHRKTSEPFAEAFLTPKRAARELTVPYEGLLRAINAGDIPTYRVGSSQNRVRLSEVAAFIERSRTGGAP